MQWLEAQRAQLRSETLYGLMRESAEGDWRGDVHHSGGPELGFAALGKGGQDIGIGEADCGFGRRLAGGSQHIGDGADSGDGLLREGKRHGDRADQLSIDIDGAAAHSLHDAGRVERASGQARQDQGLPGADVLQNAQDLHLEILDTAAGEDGLPRPPHTRLDILEREKLDGGAGRSQPAGDEERAFDQQPGGARLK